MPQIRATIYKTGLDSDSKLEVEWEHLENLGPVRRISNAEDNLDLLSHIFDVPHMMKTAQREVTAKGASLAKAYGQLTPVKMRIKKPKRPLVDSELSFGSESAYDLPIKAVPSRCLKTVEQEREDRRACEATKQGNRRRQRREDKAKGSRARRYNEAVTVSREDESGSRGRHATRLARKKKNRKKRSPRTEERAPMSRAVPESTFNTSKNGAGEGPQVVYCYVPPPPAAPLCHPATSTAFGFVPTHSCEKPLFTAKDLEPSPLVPLAVPFQEFVTAPAAMTMPGIVHAPFMAAPPFVSPPSMPRMRLQRTSMHQKVQPEPAPSRKFDFQKFKQRFAVRRRDRKSARSPPPSPTLSSHSFDRLRKRIAQERHTCFDCGIERSSYYHKLHPLHEERRTLPKPSKCRHCRRDQEHDADRPRTDKMAGNRHYLRLWCRGCGVLRSRSYHDQHPPGGMGGSLNMCAVCEKRKSRKRKTRNLSPIPLSEAVPQTRLADPFTQKDVSPSTSRDSVACVNACSRFYDSTLSSDHTSFVDHGLGSLDSTPAQRLNGSPSHAGVRNYCVPSQNSRAFLYLADQDITPTARKHSQLDEDKDAKELVKSFNALRVERTPSDISVHVSCGSATQKGNREPVTPPEPRSWPELDEASSADARDTRTAPAQPGQHVCKCPHCTGSHTTAPEPDMISRRIINPDSSASNAQPRAFSVSLLASESSSSKLKPRSILAKPRTLSRESSSSSNRSVRFSDPLVSLTKQADEDYDRTGYLEPLTDQDRIQAFQDLDDMHTPDQENHEIGPLDESPSRPLTTEEIDNIFAAGEKLYASRQMRKTEEDKKKRKPLCELTPEEMEARFSTANDLQEPVMLCELAEEERRGARNRSRGASSTSRRSFYEKSRSPSFDRVAGDWGNISYASPRSEALETGKCKGRESMSFDENMPPLRFHHARTCDLQRPGLSPSEASFSRESSLPLEPSPFFSASQKKQSELHGFDAFIAPTQAPSFHGHHKSHSPQQDPDFFAYGFRCVPPRTSTHTSPKHEASFSTRRPRSASSAWKETGAYSGLGTPASEWSEQVEGWNWGSTLAHLPPVYDQGSFSRLWGRSREFVQHHEPESFHPMSEQYVSFEDLGHDRAPCGVHSELDLPSRSRVWEVTSDDDVEDHVKPLGRELIKLMPESTAKEIPSNACKSSTSKSTPKPATCKSDVSGKSETKAKRDHRPIEYYDTFSASSGASPQRTSHRIDNGHAETRKY